MPHTIDDIDAQMLRLLQQDGRMQRNTLADAVGLSVSAVSERMRKLEERGLITGYYAVVDAKRLHLDITAFIRVAVDGSEHYAAFLDAVTALDTVLEVHSITGDGSHILKVRTRNTSTLERLLAHLQALDGVGRTGTSLVLSTFKETRTVPITTGEVLPAD